MLFESNSLKRFLGFVLSCLFITSSASLASPSGDQVLGDWLTAEGRSKVTIYRCEQKYCGKITWLKEPVYPASDTQGMAGKPKIDRDNPDPALRSRKLIGLIILEDFRFIDNAYEDGTIYDPKKGKTYSCIITFMDSNTLQVRGYIGFSLIGRTTNWTRPN